MSIFKDNQRDQRTLWQWIQGVLFRATCKSHITPPNGQKHMCALAMGHSGRHKDGSMKWGYGDDYFA